MRNLYFELTEEFNAAGTIAVLAAGQAVVFYRIAIMSKDGDWILRETGEACRQALTVLARHSARYRPGAPLDVRWLAGGWSAHFEFADPEARRIRCDFLTRPPRLSAAELAGLFVGDPSPEPLAVVGLEALIHMKRTQRAKDYPVIAELARRLPPGREIELTTDPDRILALAPEHGATSRRAAVQAARAGSPRSAVVAALAAEIDDWQERDRLRVERYQQAAETYLARFRAEGLGDLHLFEAHERLCAIAHETLPVDPLKEPSGADAQ